MQLLTGSSMDAPEVSLKCCNSGLSPFPYSTSHIVENNQFIIFMKNALVFCNCL